MPRKEQYAGPTDADKQAVRGLLEQADNVECDEPMVERYLRAEKGNVSTAAARIHETLGWRRANRPGSVVCTLCIKDPHCHYLHPVGYTKTGNPVLYSCNSLAKDRSTEGHRQHMIMTFEQTIKLMPPGVEKWVWFADFEGFSIKDAGPGTARVFLELAARHYPERLQKFWIVGAPKIFGGLWNAIQPFIDPATKQKVAFFPYDVSKTKSLLKPAMDTDFAPECKEWLLTEMAENRTKSTKKDKLYDQKEIHAAIATKAPLQRHWGSSSLLEKIASDPSILDPIANAMAQPVNGKARPNKRP